MSRLDEFTALLGQPYRVSDGPNRDALDVWNDQTERRIGGVVHSAPGEFIAGYHYENDDVLPLGRHETWRAALRALVQHDRAVAADPDSPRRAA